MIGQKSFLDRWPKILEPFLDLRDVFRLEEILYFLFCNVRVGRADAETALENAVKRGPKGLNLGITDGKFARLLIS